MKLKNIIAILISSVIFFTVTGFSQYSLLQGRWISNGDPKSVLIITTTKYIEIYNSHTISSEDYHRSNQLCDTTYLKNNSRQDIDFIHIEDGRCFEILGLTKRNLSLMYTVSGKILTFHKFKYR